MQINISTRHGNLSEAAQQKLREKAEKLSRFIERISKIDIVVDLEKSDRPAMELVVTTELKKEFQASYSSDDLYGCLDQITDKLEQQMRKFKEKLTDHR